MDPQKQGPSDDVELVQANATNTHANTANVSNSSAQIVTPLANSPEPPLIPEPSYGGLKHAFSRNNPVPAFDNLRTILILLVILYNAILETVANYPDINEETSPTQFLILSNFVGLYRNFVVGLLFFISGFGTLLSVNVYNKSLSLFVFRKSIRIMVLVLSSGGLVMLSHYVFGRRPKNQPEPGQSYYASQKGRGSLLLGPISYLGLLFCFDMSYALFRVVRQKIGVQKSRYRYNFWVTSTFVVLSIWSITAAGGFTPSLTSFWPKYDILTYDRHFPMQYIIGYLTGLFLASVWGFYLPKSPSRRAIHTFLFRLFFLCATFVSFHLFYPAMKDQLQYANPKMPPSTIEPANASGITMPVILYGLWSTLVYFLMTHSFHLLFISEASENAVQRLKQDWGLVSRLSRPQALINIFFVTFFACHVGWINHIILKCLFVWAATTLSGYALAAVCENIIWGIASRLFGKKAESLQRWDTIQFVWNHIIGTVDEKSVKTFKALLGDVKTGDALGMDPETGTPVALDEPFVLTDELDVLEEIQESTSNAMTEDEQHEDNIQARSHNIDNLRMTLVILLVFRYAIVQTIANAPTQTKAKSPVQFVILEGLVDLNKTTVVPMLYFISGMWSTHVMEVQKWSRLGYLRTRALKSAAFIIPYFAASILVRRIYWDTRSTTLNEFILTDGSILYVLLLFAFDCIHALALKNPTPTKFQSGFELPLARYIYSQVICGLWSKIVAMGIVYAITCVWRGDRILFYVDPQFLGLYAVAYFAGVHFSSSMIYTFLSANVLGGRPALTLFLRTILSALYLNLGDKVCSFMSFTASKGEGSQTQTPTKLSIVTYGYVVPSIFFILGPSTLLLFFYKPTLMKNWGLFSRVTYFQPVIQTFLVIGIARHTGWIGNLLVRCAFVGVASVALGWIAAIIPMVIWRLVVGNGLNRSRYQSLDSTGIA